MTEGENYKDFDASISAAARAVATDRPSLSDSRVVGKYVREFVGGIVLRVASAGNGSMTREAAIAADKQACIDAANVFLGRDDAYDASGQWNSGGGLVAWTQSTIGKFYSERYIAKAGDMFLVEAFALCLKSVYEIASFHAAHDYDASYLQDDLIGVVDTFTKFLLGIHSAFDSVSVPTMMRRGKK